MATIFKISGTAGAALDTTKRTLGDIAAKDATVSFSVLGDDEAVITLRTVSADGMSPDGNYYLPDPSQVVRLWRNDGGADERIFRGHALPVEIGMDFARLRIVGPWWWLRQQPISEVKAGARSSGTGERPSYVFPEQNIRLSLRAVNELARAAGIELKAIASGDEASFFSLAYTGMKMVLSGSSLADAATEVMTMVPDGNLWFDHSVTGENVSMRMTRRGAMTPKTWTIGVDIERITRPIRARQDLKIERVEMHYVERHPTTGQPRWARSGSGTASAGKLQMIPVSGWDSVDLVPIDDFDKVTLKTIAAKFGTADYFALDPVLKQAVQQFGGFLGSAPVWTVPGWYQLKQGQMTDWLRKERGAILKPMRLTGWLKGTYNGTKGLGGCATYLKSIGRLGWNVGTGVDHVFRLFVDFEFNAFNLAFPKKTTVYKRWEWDYLKPPANLTDNLKDAQSWLPYEGEFVVFNDADLGRNMLDRKVRIAGSRTELATADALMNRISHELLTKRTTVSLGAPARTDWGSLVSRIKRKPAGAIVYL